MTALPPWYFLLHCGYVRLTESKKRATCGHAWITLKKKRKKEKLLWKPLECKKLRGSPVAVVCEIDDLIVNHRLEL